MPGFEKQYFKVANPAGTAGGAYEIQKKSKVKKGIREKQLCPGRQKHQLVLWPATANGY